MVTIERRVGGLIRYHKVWFPSHEQALEISSSLRPNEVARFFAAPSDLRELPHLVKHRQLQTSWIDLSIGPEGLLNGMKRKSCRYEIRRAEKMLDRVEIEIGSAKALADFLTVYNAFAEMKNLPKLPAPWFREYSAHGETLVLYLNGAPLCCHLVLLDPGKRIVRLIFSGSRRLDTVEDASACGALNRYLHWHELQRYQAQGFATFDFGGIRHPEDPISRFKLSFGGAVVSEHYYLLSGTRWVASFGNAVYEKLLRRRVLVAKSDGRESNGD